jgi:hypothetical protein
MAIVVIGGSSRGIGKTALMCGLIAVLKEQNWTAVKIASHEHWNVEPIWEENSSTDSTDTSRYLAAGARRAFLLTAPEVLDPNETGLGLTLGEFFPQAGRGVNIIFESNRVLYHVQPGLCLMVEGRGQDVRKPSFVRVAERANAIVSFDGTDEPRSPGLLEIERRVPVFHLPQYGIIPHSMELWVREHLGLPHCHSSR